MANSNATVFRNVIVDLPDYPAGVITFKLRTYFAAEGTEGFPQKEYSLTLSATGQGTQALPTPSSGAWLYEVGLPDGNNPLATLAAGADIQLTAWLAAALSSETANSLEDYFLLLTGGVLTGAITVASLTTAERDALTPAEGMAIYNETTATVQVYQGAAWVSVGAAGAVAIDDLTDVVITTPADNELLAFDNASGDWINQTATEAGLSASGHTHSYQPLDAGLTDLAGLAPGDGIIPVGDGANWVAESGATARESLGAAALGANTFTGEQNLADNLLTRPKLKDYGETVNAIGSIGGGTQDIDLTLGNVVTATVDTAETTFTFSNPPASGTAGSFTLRLTNGGSQTVNWPASVLWPGGTEPELTAAGLDVLTFMTVDGGTTWDGFGAGLDMQ